MRLCGEAREVGVRVSGLDTQHVAGSTAYVMTTSTRAFDRDPRLDSELRECAIFEFRQGHEDALRRTFDFGWCLCFAMYGG